MTFGTLLRRIRLSAAISQEELATRAGLSSNAVSALERGDRRAPHRSTIAALAHALAATPEERTALVYSADRARGRKRPTPAAPARATIASHNLPQRITTFVGRETEYAELGQLLDGGRIVTVTGSGGIGKTRLALEVADARLGAHDEIRFVDLTLVSETTLTVGRIASLIGRVSSQHADVEVVAEGIGTRRVLLLFDNCEHVVRVTAKIIERMLRLCPNVRVLATSRERLAIAGEVVYRLSGLAVPPDARTHAMDPRLYSAMALLAERARAKDRSFSVPNERVAPMVSICRRLDGIPLAIEMAAALVPTMGISRLDDLLKSRLCALAGSRDLPPRQRTLDATIAWSLDVLDPDARLLFSRLAVFDGGCTLSSAESVCADAALAATDVPRLLCELVEKSLVNSAKDGDSMRYSFFESTRAFATKSLAESGEEPAARARHAAWIAQFADRADESYPITPRDRWMRIFERELGNVRAALDWTLGLGNDALTAGRIVGGLRGLWTTAGLRTEGSGLARAVARRIDAEHHPATAARVMRALAEFTDGSERVAATERADALSQRSGDHWEAAARLVERARGCADVGRFASAEAMVERATGMLRDEGHVHSLAYARTQIEHADISRKQGRIPRAHRFLHDAIHLASALGDDWTELEALRLLAEVRFDCGDAVEAERTATAALSRARERGWDVLTIGLLGILGSFALLRDDVDGAAHRTLEALVLSRGREPSGFYRAVRNAAVICAARGDGDRAARLTGAADAWFHRTALREDAKAERINSMLRGRLAANLSSLEMTSLSACGAKFSDEVVANEAIDGTTVPFVNVIVSSAALGPR